MAFLYPNLEQAIEVHRKTIEVSGGGAYGIIDTSKLASVLEHVQNDSYYPTIEAKLTHLFFCANKFHCFEDGNKRIAISLGAQFLLINGYVWAVRPFLEEMENISWHVASGRIDKDLLGDVISAVLADNMEDISLKLRIYNAIKDEAQL